MANVITINRPDVIILIEEAAKKLTGGSTTQAVALGMRRLLEQEARSGSLFGAHSGSVRVREGVDLNRARLRYPARRRNQSRNRSVSGCAAARHTGDQIRPVTSSPPGGVT